MKKSITALLLLLACCTAGHAQNRAQILESINAIKAQSDKYFWNEYTHAEADTAAYNATRGLLADINTRRNDPLTVDDIMPSVEHIQMSRGSLTRDFAYILKSDVGLDADAPALPADAPVATTVVPAATPATPAVPRQRAFVPDQFVQRVLGYKTFYEVYQYLQNAKLDRQIMQFGPLKDIEDYRSLDLIVFDMKSKEVLCVLSGENADGQRTNLATGTPDTLDNYPDDMVLVIWYIK